VLGGTIDLWVAGHSFFAGTVIGAGVGAALGWLGGSQVASMWSNSSRTARALFPGDTGRFLAMGPVSSPRYAWVLLDRGLVHLRVVRDRSHARRDAIGGQEVGLGIVAELPRTLRDPLDATLLRVLKDVRSRRSASPDTRRELEARLYEVVMQLAPRA